METIIEWMIDAMVSGEYIPEEKLAAFRLWLAEGSDMGFKAEGLRLAVNKLASRGFSRSDADEGSEVARERWRKLAVSLGMNPELNYYRAIRANHKADSAKSGKPAKQAKHTVRRRLLTRAAAVLLPMAFVVGAYSLYNRTQDVPAGFVATHTVASQQDSVRHITLPDGTQVTLNRNSTFSYNDSREGELSGEAYFKVAKDDGGEPFVIHSEYVEVTVLGTEFYFSAREEDDNSTLLLYKGAVQLDYAEGTHRLEEGGKEFSLDHATLQSDVSEFDVMEQPEWLADENLYHFHSLGDIFHSMESEYGVRFENMNSIDTTQRISFRAQKGTSLETLMSVLKEASDDFDYTINEGTIILQP